MKTRLRRFHPSFLKRLDHYLLLNHPMIWMSKIHMVLFYGVLFLIGLEFMISSEITLSDSPHIDRQAMIVSIPCLIAMMFWAIFLRRKMRESLSGKHAHSDRMRTQVLCLICLSIFLVIPLIFGQRLAHRTAHSEIIQHRTVWHDYGYPSYSSKNTYYSYWKEKRWTVQQILPLGQEFDFAYNSETKHLFYSMTILFYLWLFLMLFVRMKRRDYLLFFLSGCLTLYFLLFFLESFCFRYTGGGWGFFPLYIFWMLFLILPSFSQGGQKKQSRLGKKINLAHASLLSPLLIPLIIPCTQLHSSVNSVPYWMLGMLISFFLWHRLFEPRFIALETEPAKR